MPARMRWAVAIVFVTLFVFLVFGCDRDREDTRRLTAYEKMVVQGQGQHRLPPFHTFTGAGAKAILTPECEEIVQDILSDTDTDTGSIPYNGLLFYGPPGTGKTTVAETIAHQFGGRLIRVSADQVENKYVGESFKRIQAVFSAAVKLAPCVLLVDEIDGMMSSRTGVDQSHTTTMKTLFLTGMDLIMSSDVQVLVIGCTNRPHALDRALLRRFEVHLEFSPPGPAQIREHLRHNWPSSKTQLLTNSRFVDWMVNVFGKHKTLHDINLFMRHVVRRGYTHPNSRLPPQESDEAELETTGEDPSDPDPDPEAEAYWTKWAEKFHRLRL
eukprot:693256-Prorocentrum_minimum.AAC.24